MGKFFKIAMFITSFIPLWITILFIDVISIIKKNQYLITEIIGIAVIFVILSMSILIIVLSMKSITLSSYKIYKIEAATQEKGITSEFLLSYVLPLFAFDFTQWDSVVQFLIYFFILAFLCIRNNNVYANLIFECLNYKFYTCDLIWAPEPNTPAIQAIVISNSNLCAMKGNTIDVAPLNKPFYIKKKSVE